MRRIAWLSPVLIAVILMMACQQGSTREQPVTPTVAATLTPALASDSRLSVAVRLRDAAERERVTTAIDATANLRAVADAAGADATVGDDSLSGGTRYVLAAWAAVTDQRRDVLELGLDDLRRILRGEVTDWSALGGGPMPIAAYLPAEDAERIAAALDLATDAIQASLAPADSIPGLVDGQPGALALLPVAALRPGLLALVVEGYDPYRDPSDASPIALVRRVQAPDAATTERIAALAGWDVPLDPIDPVGVLATGELIPVRCTNAALERVGDIGAMFDSTRAFLRAADLTVMPLEVALTDRGPPTPCVSTFLLQGRAAVVDAVAEAGVDVIITAGNHAMDCWSGCAPAEALGDTLALLDGAGLTHAGAAGDLAAARTAAIVERDGVRFAFLGYDDIARYYAATDRTAGTAPLDLATLAEDVARAKARADHVIVGFGWGIEYTADPTSRQREAAAIAVEAGASLVIGNHPHWVQAVELLDGALAVYSLGNFVFDQSWSVETTQSMVVEAGFTRNRLLGFRLRPVVIRGTTEVRRGLYRPELVDPAGEGAPILQRVWDATDRLPDRTPRGE